jgi:hypothetical protein
MPPPLVTDTITFTSDEAQATEDLFRVLCRARTVYDLTPQALAEIVSVLSAEVLGRLIAAGPEQAGLTVSTAVFLEDWACETQRRALDVARTLTGEGEGNG